MRERIKRLIEDLEQVERKRIEDVKIDTTNGISVSCSGTDFVNLKFIEPKDDKVVRETFKKLVKLCRENHIRVMGRKNVEEALAFYPQYLEAVNTWNAVVSELQEIWTKIVEEGIYYGCADDERIKAAHEKRFKIEPLWYRNTAASKYSEMAYEIKRRLEEVEWNLKDPSITMTGVGF